MIKWTSIVLALLLLANSAWAQDYPKAKSYPKAKTSSKKSSQAKTPVKRASRPSNRVSANLEREGKSAHFRDGVALYGVNHNQILKTRKPWVRLYLTDKTFTSAEMKEIREKALQRLGAYDLAKLLEARGGKWLDLTIEFDPKQKLYTARSARWYVEDFSWKKGSASTVSIVGDGITKLSSAYSLLKIEPDEERLSIRSRYRGWDLNLDMTMWVREKF